MELKIYAHGTKPTIYPKKFPENKPTVSGYYMADHIENGKIYHKAIYWLQEKRLTRDGAGRFHHHEQVWVGWRTQPHLNVIHTPLVICYWEETREDFYCPCLEKARGYIIRVGFDWESIVAPHQTALSNNYSAS